MTRGRTSDAPHETALARLNGLVEIEAITAFLQCCGSRAWAERMAAARPFASVSSLLETADNAWRSLPDEAWLEAFAAHPPIGADSGRSDTMASEWSRGEQSGMRGAGADLQRRLAECNARYRERFGRVFLICASGRGAEEMLAELERRLSNDSATELRAAAEEQRLITRLRLGKLLGMQGANKTGLTTHVLDLARGRPGAGIAVTLLRLERGESFIEIARRETDADGRVGGFLDAGTLLDAGVYRLRFDTQAYFERLGVETFWPHVEITFRISDPSQHHHVPLLLSPFGYTTYRGT